MPADGIIQFQCRWIKTGPLHQKKWSRLNHWRSRMYAAGLVGMDGKGVGFGNLSERSGSMGRFIITGSQTGHLAELDGRHYTEVIRSDFPGYSLVCQGPVQPSSESMTHAAIYDKLLWAKACIHIHHPVLWKKLLKTMPATRPRIHNGSPEMVNEIARLAETGALDEARMVVMAGHRDGLMFFGHGLDEAGDLVIKQLSLNHRG